MLSSVWEALNPKNIVNRKLFDFDIHKLWNAIQSFNVGIIIVPILCFNDFNVCGERHSLIAYFRVPEMVSEKNNNYIPIYINFDVGVLLSFI